MRVAACLTLIGCVTACAFGQSTESDAKQPAPQKVSAVDLLNARMSEFSFEDARLEDALNTLAEQLNTNIVVHWSRLEAVGIDRDTTVSLRARNLRVSQVLWMLLSDFDAEGAKLAYRADNDMLLITTEDEFGEEMITRVYDISDLLMVAPRFGPEASFGRTRQYVSTVRPQVANGAVGVQPIIATASSGVSLWGDTNPWSGESGVSMISIPGEDEIERARARRKIELLEMIPAVIAPESWDVNGGRGTLREMDGLLIVRNTPLVHQMLGGPVVESK